MAFKEKRTWGRRVVRFPSKRVIWGVMAFWVLAGWGTGSMPACAAEPTTPFRLMLAKNSFTGLNANDAKAAILAWAKIILKQRGIISEVESRFAENFPEIVEALRLGEVDAVSMITTEFSELKNKPEFLFFTLRNEMHTEKYVILVHQNGGISDIRQLGGRKLLLYNSPRMSLAPAWLSVLFSDRSMGAPEAVLGGISRIDNPSRTVLPVFFRQADVAVVTAGVFEVAGELNPQLRKDIRVLETSPGVIPALFFFRPGYESDIKDNLEDAILSLHESPAGRQVLNIFQGERMIKEPVSCLDATLKLLRDAGLQKVARSPEKEKFRQ